MEKKRPPLNLHELNQTRWLLGGLLTLVALTSVVFLDVSAWVLLGVTTFAVAVSLLRPASLVRVPHWVHKLAFPVVLGAFVFDYYTFHELLPALVRLGILLLLYRTIGYRKRRDDLQLILLGLFLIVVTGVLTVSIGFALEIIVFTALALGLLLTRTLVDAAEMGNKSTLPASYSSEAPAWTAVHWPILLRRLLEVSDWRVWCFAVLLFGGLVALSGVLFLSIPRFQLESSLFLDRWMNKKSLTGFSDTLRFGEVSDIQKDESVAMHVEVSDATKLPADLYWRMTVLDEYRDRAFGMSAALKARLSPEVTRSNINNFGLPSVPSGLQWTFYLEPGVSRYLPLLGGFRHLEFTEPQVFRISDRMRLLVLSRDPSTMKAFRIISMDTTGIVRERMSGEAGARLPEFLALFQNVPFAKAEQETWLRAAQEISGGQTLSAVEFSARATKWLHAKHQYALKSRVPAGSGDPLTRWCLSREPGHCELFAGSFAMVARSAGFPCRIVAGFLGGNWNGDYLVVRNSNAHAWCEIYDGRGSWLRVDPTVPPASGELSHESAGALNRLQTESGFSAQIDRLRMLWYRHIVNFDRSDQQNLVRSFKEKTEHSSQELRETFQKALRAALAWLRGPWDFGRSGTVGLGLLFGAFLFWWWRRFGRGLWVASKRVRPTAIHPVRLEAGRWLLKMERLRSDEVNTSVGSTEGGLVRLSESETEFASAISELQRLRYGRVEGWPEPVGTFRRARRALKAAKKNCRART